MGVVVVSVCIECEGENVTMGSPGLRVLPLRAHYWEGTRSLHPRANLGLDPRSARASDLAGLSPLSLARRRTRPPGHQRRTEREGSGGRAGGD